MRCRPGQQRSQDPPPRVAGRAVKFRDIPPDQVWPPTFALFANRPQVVPEDHARDLTGALRKAFALPGVPLRRTLHRTKNPYADGR